MPPRWLLITVITVYSTSWIKSVMAADLLNTMPVASNGWRPIVGTQLKPYSTIEQQSQKQTISLTSNDHEHTNKNDKNKIAPGQKINNGNGNLVHINHHGSTGHHPLTHSKTKPLNKPISGKPAPRHPVLGKLHAHLANGKRHKPGTQPPLPREEIMAPAPSSAIGSYAYFNQGPITIQNTQLGPNKPYHSPGHVDFSNHFAFSNINDVVIPQQQYTYHKHPSQNELHPPHYVFFNQHDDFTRNLVPPPPIYKPQGEKETLLKEPPTLGTHKEEVSRLPENIIVQYQQQPSFDFEITKENFQEYHTTLAPSTFKTSTEPYLVATKPRQFTKHSYEVTEDKEWTEQLPQFKTIYPTAKPFQQNNRFQQFLPTPYSPESAFPTSPTQAEVSTIYSEISQMNKKKNAFKIPSTTVYNLKEVATHFPIYSNEKPPDTQLNTPVETTTKTEETTTRRPSQRRRRPRPTTTTESLNTDQYFETERPSIKPHTHRRPRPTSTTESLNTDQYLETERPSIKPHTHRRPRPTTSTESLNTDQYFETERPSIKPHTHRRRRPVKYRTTETPSTEAPTRTYRPTRPQPQTITEEVFIHKNHNQRYRPSYHTYNLDIDEETTPLNIKEPTEENVSTEDLETGLPTTTTETLQNTNLNLPENELDYTTTIQEPEDTTINFDTTTSTTTTTEATTTKSNRIRQRPIKYGVDRPRFSVKDYRQRLNQYMSTSTSEPTNQETSSIKIRYPNRFKISTTTATDTDESTESSRQKFIPKESRRRYTTESSDVSSTEKYLRTMNPRLKSFGRYRSTTEPTPSSTTQRVAIKPNIFSNLKRPQQLSLRNRIFNKKRNSTTTTTTEAFTESPETESSLNTEKTEVTIPFEIAESKIEITTQLYDPIEDEEEILTTTGKVRQTELPVVKKYDDAEAFLQLQRISDLTSSAHKQYNTPGLFKSVSPTSRRVPSYFTIATEDPILPIEAFFPNLNQKANDRQ